MEKEIPEEDDSGRKKYLIKNRNDVLSGLISQRRLVAEDAKDAIIHEYGHHVHNKASSESNIFGSKELKSRKFAGSYEWGGVHEGKVTAAQVSDYATESPLEAFAESFTAYVKGEDIPESLKSVVEGAIEKTGGKLKQPVVKVPDSGIIKSKIANEEISVTKIQNLGKINTKVLEKEFGKIQTDDIIVTNERIDHIKERHPEDYDLFEKYGRESVSDPDLIIKDIKNKGTVFMIKKLPETNLNVVVRVVLETDDSKLKNSVMTFYRIRERNLKKLIEKNGMLYKKE